MELSLNMWVHFFMELFSQSQEDMNVMLENWLSVAGGDRWYVLCDLYEDDGIDLKDWAKFVSDWQWQAGWYEP